MTVARRRAVMSGLGLAVVVAVIGGTAVWIGRRGTGADRLLVTGTIEATQVAVGPRVAGRLVELGAREGDEVRRGQVLARLDAAEAAADLRRVEAGLRAAEARLRDLESGARPEELREAEARLARAQARVADLAAGARPEELAQATALVASAEATVARARTEAARAGRLHTAELLARQEVDRAVEAVTVAEAAREGVRERLALLRAGPRPDELAAVRAAAVEAGERLAALRAGVRPEVLAAARAGAAEARAAVEQARARLAETTLLSPIDGRVLRRSAEPGEAVVPGATLLELVDPRDLWLRAWVGETELGRVRVGQAARVSVDSFPGRAFAGRVSVIATEAEFTPKNVQTRSERVNLVYRIRVALDGGADGLLKPGMPADAELLP